eukprot:868271-Pleurochrysis_carterae.AAC.1
MALPLQQYSFVAHAQPLRHRTRSPACAPGEVRRGQLRPPWHRPNGLERYHGTSPPQRASPRPRAQDTR